MSRTRRRVIVLSAVVLCATALDVSVFAKKKPKRRKSRARVVRMTIPIVPRVASPTELRANSANPTNSASTNIGIHSNEDISRSTLGKQKVKNNSIMPQPSASPVQAGEAIISEARLRGPAGAEDEFVEIYNNTDVAITVASTDGSSGWSVVISDGSITGPIFTIPNGTVIPARGHLLGANINGYSLCNYPSGNGTLTVTAPPGPKAVAPCLQNGIGGTFSHTIPDRTWDFDVADGSGIALFSTTNGTNFTAGTRLDAFGFSGSPALFKEGAGFPDVVTANTEHTYYRDLRNAVPKDTGDNGTDFRLVGTPINIQIKVQGAPGPENLNSPILNTSTIAVSVLDPSVAPSAVPNRERNLNPEPNADFGTLLFRHTFTNNTGAPVSRLRFRVVEITTNASPLILCGGSPCADLRPLTSQDGTAATGAGVVAVRGVRLEEPPDQPAGGGFNSSLSADFITLGTPLPPGQSVNIVFKLGVMRPGTYRFFLIIEAQNSSLATT